MTTVLIGLGVIAGALASGVSVFYAALRRGGRSAGGDRQPRHRRRDAGRRGHVFAIAAITGNAVLGVLAGAAAGMAFNLILGLLVVTRRTEPAGERPGPVVPGTGVSTLIGLSYTGTHIDGLGEVRLPGSGLLPAAWARVIDQDILVYLALPAALAVTWLLWRTRWGLHLRAVGEDRMAAFAAGLNPAWLQYQALALAGALYGLGGAQLALAYTKTWQEGMTAGRGFVAVVIVIFALWRPLRAIAGALLFGGAVALGFQLQVRGLPVSPFLLDMLPYA